MKVLKIKKYRHKKPTLVYYPTVHLANAPKYIVELTYSEYLVVLNALMKKEAEK